MNFFLIYPLGVNKRNETNQVFVKGCVTKFKIRKANRFEYSMKKKILLINYTYPPFDSIGSRRWAKLSKNLANAGNIINVISAENPYQTKSLWNEDVQHENIKVHVLNRMTLNTVFFPEKSILFRIVNKIYFYGLSFFVKGFVRDYSIFWERKMKKKAKEIISQANITTVIGTGPPFRVLYYIAKLKGDYPNIKFISDIRDPWLDGGVFALKNIKDKVIEYEKEMFEYVLKNSDKIILTDNTYKNIIDSSHPLLKDKTLVIPHFFDVDDFSDVTIKESYVDKIRFLYGGNVPITCKKEVIIPFFEALEIMKDRHPLYYNRLEIKFYGKPKWLEELVRDKALNVISFLDFISPVEFNAVACTYDYLMIFLPVSLKNYLITKNIDYLPLRKPILIFGEEGRAAEFIEKNKLGKRIESTDMLESLMKLVESKIRINSEFDLDSYSLKHHGEKLSNVL